MSNDFEISPQSLAPEEADAFLDFLFSGVARKPEAFSLQDGAAVAHYLLALAHVTPGKEDRHLLLKQAQLLWRILFRAPWRIGSPHSARSFLKRHRDTHLGVLDVDQLLELIQEAPPIEKAEGSEGPQLLSPAMAVVGSAAVNLSDDLSARIYAAYYALRLNGIHGARGRIAKVLNLKKLLVKAPGRSTKWDADRVFERVRQQEKGTKPETRDRLRRQAADLWIYLFRDRS